MADTCKELQLILSKELRMIYGELGILTGELSLVHGELRILA